MAHSSSLSYPDLQGHRIYSCEVRSDLPRDGVSRSLLSRAYTIRLCVTNYVTTIYLWSSPPPNVSPVELSISNTNGGILPCMAYPQVRSKCSNTGCQTRY